ncbi:hypothetical protein BKA65DRAFT_36891 [Rhexocercosporidium sp. MPI-PUGE-AT-0058]|nr:hypothetical protein BKA65DRAFT_36891 [Rhexocercosporidium sp. MPI-PUGE-AT-0058]
MEIQTIELTEEDLLNMHRYYVTSLYLEDRKTVVEIVELLHEKYKLSVTVSQVTKCIREWRNQPLHRMTVGLWPLPCDRHPICHTPLVTPTSYKKSRVRKKQLPNTDKLRVTCHHGAGPSDSHEVETNLSSMPDGPSQIELYVDDDQSHERVPLGLEVERAQFSYARAAHKKDGAARRHHLAKTTKRPNHTSSRERKDRGKEDGKGKARQSTGSPSSSGTRGRESSNES